MSLKPIGTRDRQETRVRILTTARSLFVRRGYEATTMRAIADELGLTAAALYHHFRNKNELLIELATIDFRALAEAFLRIGRVSDPFERLGRICQAYVEFARTHPMQYQLMFMTVRPSGLLTKRIVRGDPGEDAYAFLRQTCAAAIATGLLRPEISDPDAMAQMLWGAAHGLVSLQIVKENDRWIEWRDLRATAATAGQAMLRGLLRAP